MFHSSARAVHALNFRTTFRTAAGAWTALLLFVFASLPLSAVPLHQISSTVYNTEHCVFIIDSSIPWSNATSAYNAIYTASGGTFPNLSNYFDTLTTQFPGTYFSVCYMANTGASNVPNYIDRIYKASGINEPGTAGAPQSFASVDICRYNLSSNALFTPIIAVYDHELGHAWGAQVFNFVSPTISNGHWLPNSTVDCQLSATYSADGGVTVNKLYGDPTNGFRWQKVDNLRSNDYETFSEQELYLMGVADKWPTSYVLNGVTYNGDGTASYSSLDTFTHASLVANYGARNPDYTVSAKRFKLGFVYIARDLTEVNSVYTAVEQSIDNFCNGEAIDTHSYRFQTPFTADTHFRASVDGLLADLDGNSTPTLSITNPYSTSTDGSATVNFTASDADGTTPTVSLLQGSNCATVVGSSVQLVNLPDGVFFFTLKAQDSGGKKTFGHFVVEVHRSSSGPTITAQPTGQTVIAGNSATFTVAVSGSPTAYQWYRQVAHTSTWDRMSDGGAYSGTASASLSVATSTSMNEDHFLCLVGNGSGTTTSAAAELRTDETVPVFLSQPSDNATAAGTSTPFTVSVGGPTTFGYFYYQWQRQAAGTSTWTDITNGGAYSGATTAAFRVVNAALMNGDKFRCQVTDTAGTSTSNAATLTSGTVPSITGQPSSVSASAGQTVSFTVTATGTAPLAYQWYLYGTPVSGGTSATLTLTNVQSTDAGAYTVHVTNAFGLAGSNVGSLTVSSSAPVISQQPQSISPTVGQNVSLSVTATGSNPLTYQWRKGGSPIGGATGTSLAFPSISLSDAGSYDVVVSNSSGSAISSSVTVTVNSGNTPPSFTTQPTGLSVTAGSPATFIAAANGSPTPTYQWKKGGITISGATSSTYSISTTSLSDAGNYTVVATNVAGSATSATATLLVNPAAVAPSITAGPADTTATAGTPASFSVSASGTGPLSYQWTKNGNALSGANASTYSIASAQMSDAGNYAVTVSNIAGYVQSSSAALTVTAAPTPPSITQQPQNTTVTTGNGLSLSVVAAGTAPLIYQWKKAGAAISGATNSIYTIASATNADAADYTVVVTNVAGSATSNAATVTVTAAATAPSITTQPQSVTVTVGNTVNFSVVSTGSAPLSYQWKRNGVALTGATSATLNLPTVQNADAGNYTVQVSNPAGSATSSTAILTVNSAATSPVITLQPQSTALALGGSATLTVAAIGTGPLSYQWYLDGVPITGANQPSLTVSNAQPQDAGNYTAAVSNSLGIVSSNAASLSLVSASNVGHLINLSVRGLAGTGSQTLIVGFIVAGSGELPVLVRGWGPTLGKDPFNVPGALADPLLRVFRDTTQIAENDNWGGDPQVMAMTAQAGAYPFAVTSKDAATFTTFGASTPNTVHILGVNTGTGVALAEVFDVTSVYTANSPRFVNLSARGQVGTGGDVLIAGFVIGGQSPITVMIRGLGPALTNFGVTGVLADPKLELHDASATIATNDNWADAPNATQVTALNTQLGLVLPTTSKDAVILATLQPGLYSVIVSGVNNTTGVALIDLNEIP